ncbi:MAG: OmpH family outer membrane protein [Akkermansiaceae bacterium]|nr:OmpH family outer membrane protein [Akkermansiaceae bacterium]NNM29062.1 OmpH family outer membrane protein [Akkermansiaceae bacterium]
MNLRIPALALVVSTALAAPSLAGPKIATVDVNKLFSSYEVTKEAQAKLDQQREALRNDPRLKVINETIEELKKLRSEIRDEDLPEASRENYFRTFQMKSHELRSLQRDTLQHLEDQKRELNLQMVARTKEILAEISGVVASVGKSAGYDLVLESGGSTSSQVPCLLYIRDATDITDLVLAELQEGLDAKKASSAKR